MRPEPAILDIELRANFHLAVEAAAAVLLVLGIIMETQFLMVILRRQATTERGLSIASGNLGKVLDDYFRTWGLSQLKKMSQPSP